MDRRPGIAAQLYQVLRDRIVSLELKPHTLLSRAEIAEQFRVSQMPVREALLRLEAAGLIDVYPQSRTEVAPIDVGKVIEVRFLRRALELECALTLASMSDAEALRGLHGMIEAQESVMRDEAMLDRFMALDLDFHRKMFEAVGQPAAHELILEKSVHLDRIRRLQLPMKGKRVTIVREHQAIVAAIESGDPLRVIAAVRGHLSGTTMNIDDLIAKFPDYF